MNEENTRITRSKERLLLFMITAVMGLLFISLYTVLYRDFKDVRQRLDEGTMVNLNDKDPGKRIKTLLEKGYYFDDPKDIDLVSSVVNASLNTEEGKIDNIGELNLRKYYVVADDAFARGGTSYKKRVAASRSLLGYTGYDEALFVREQSKPLQLPAITDIGMNGHSISGIIQNKEDQPVSGVLLRLEMIIPQESTYGEQVSEVPREIVEEKNGTKTMYLLDSANKRQLQSLTAYARTDAQGKYAFKNLPADKAFELVPLQPG